MHFQIRPKALIRMGALTGVGGHLLQKGKKTFYWGALN